MRLDLDNKTGKLTVASREKAAEILRTAATVANLLVVTGQVKGTHKADMTLVEVLEDYAAGLTSEAKE